MSDDRPEDCVCAYNGALHEGHLSLVETAKESADVVAVSIFVNPLSSHPMRTLKAIPGIQSATLAYCRRWEWISFSRPLQKMYPDDHTFFVDEEKISKTLCGVSRPSHFRGVATVCTKLLNIVLPDFLVVGMKDAQQAIILNRLIRNLHFSH